MPIVSVGRHYWPRDVEGLIVPGEGEDPQGLVTWAVDGDTAEIVTLDAFPPGQGTGAVLLRAAEQTLEELGVVRVRLMTSNDNTPGLRFYVRHGYRLAQVHLDAFDEVYRLKPQAPRTGREGIVLRDLWELQKQLVS